jgi:hypothetical protein
MVPSAKAWLTATRPCRPAAIVRSAMSRSSAAPVSPKSQMDVDSLAERLGEAENEVELAVDVAVEAGRVEAADQVGAGHQGRGQEVGRPGLGRHAALREGDELNVDPVAKGLAHPDHSFEIVEADIVVDIDMAAGARHAVHDQRTDKRRRAGLNRQGHLMALGPLDDNALAHAASLDMRQAGRAPMSLVEMEVPVDERREEEHPFEIDAFAGRRRGPRRMPCDDEPAGDFDVGETPLGQARVGQDHQTRFSRFAAAY